MIMSVVWNTLTIKSSHPSHVKSSIYVDLANSGDETNISSINISSTYMINVIHPFVLCRSRHRGELFGVRDIWFLAHGLGFRVEVLMVVRSRCTCFSQNILVVLLLATFKGDFECRKGEEGGRVTLRCEHSHLQTPLLQVFINLKKYYSTISWLQNSWANCLLP